MTDERDDPCPKNPKASHVRVLPRAPQICNSSGIIQVETKHFTAYKKSMALMASMMRWYTRHFFLRKTSRIIEAAPSIEGTAVTLGTIARTFCCVSEKGGVKRGLTIVCVRNGLCCGQSGGSGLGRKRRQRSQCWVWGVTEVWRKESGDDGTIRAWLLICMYVGGQRNAKKPLLSGVSLVGSDK